MQKKIEVISPAVMKGLTTWDWPGNTRELENFIERAVIVTRGRALEAPLGELRRLNTEQPPSAARNSDQEEIARIVKETLNAINGAKGSADERAQKQREAIVRALSQSKGRVGGNGRSAYRHPRVGKASLLRDDGQSGSNLILRLPGLVPTGRLVERDWAIRDVNCNRM